MALGTELQKCYFLFWRNYDFENHGHKTSLLICNHQVASSKPAAGTNRIKHLAQPSWLGFVASEVCVSICKPFVTRFGRRML
jgi:hypothetical protein